MAGAAVSDMDILLLPTGIEEDTLEYFRKADRRGVLQGVRIARIPCLQFQGLPTDYKYLLALADVNGELDELRRHPLEIGFTPVIRMPSLHTELEAAEFDVAVIPGAGYWNEPWVRPGNYNICRPVKKNDRRICRQVHHLFLDGTEAVVPNMLEDGLPLEGIQTSLPLQDFTPQSLPCHLDRGDHLSDARIDMPIVRLPVNENVLDGRLSGVALVAVDIGHDVLEFGWDFEGVRVEVNQLVDKDFIPAPALVGHERLDGVNLKPG